MLKQKAARRTIYNGDILGNKSCFLSRTRNLRLLHDQTFGILPQNTIMKVWTAEMEVRSSVQKSVCNVEQYSVTIIEIRVNSELTRQAVWRG